MDPDELMDEQVEIAPGEFKRLGDCTRPELGAAIELGEAKLRELEAKAEREKAMLREVVPPEGESGAS